MSEPKTKEYQKRPMKVKAFKAIANVEVKTILGVVIAKPGDFIAIGSNGEQQVYPPHVFKQLFEEIKIT